MALPLPSTEILQAVCEFNVTEYGADRFPTMAAIAAGTVGPEELRESLKLRGELALEATVLEGKATSRELGNPGRVAYVDARTLIGWVDHLAGLNPSATFELDVEQHL